MGNVVANIALGRFVELHKRVNDNDPANAGLLLVLYKTIEADSALLDYDTLAAALAAGGGANNVEADFTNYARVEQTDADVGAPAVDDTNNRQEVDLADEVYGTAGGASNNTLAKLGIYYVPDLTSYTDSDAVPLVWLDVVVTTNGSDVTIQFNANGYGRAAQPA